MEETEFSPRKRSLKRVVWYGKVSGNVLQAGPVPPPDNKITCPSIRTGTAHNPTITATFEAQAKHH
jgi:hypothetical protein